MKPSLQKMPTRSKKQLKVAEVGDDMKDEDDVDVDAAVLSAYDNAS